MGAADEHLQVALEARIVHVNGNDLSRFLMTNFPCSVGRVDWRRARSVVVKPAPASRSIGANVGGDSLQTALYVEEVIAFFNDCMQRHSLRDDWVGFVGDSMEGEYKAQIGSIPELLRLVSDVPDHKYIFSLHGEWCFMWSFEDDLFFGLREPT